MSRARSKYDNASPGGGSSRFVLAALGWVVSLGAIGWGVLALADQWRATRPLVECRLVWTQLPEWSENEIGRHVLDGIAAHARLPVDCDLYDPALCQQVAQGVAESPWIAAVRETSKRPTGEIVVQADFRMPFAFVESENRAYLVDAGGVRLPMECPLEGTGAADDAVWNRFLRICGAHAGPPPVGQPWPGEDLAAGLKLVSYLRAATAAGEVPFRATLRQVDVANFGRRLAAPQGELRIRTIYPNCLIHWGIAPGEEQPIENKPAVKLRMLQGIYAQKGCFPEDWIDVRWPNLAIGVPFADQVKPKAEPPPAKPKNDVAAAKPKADANPAKSRTETTAAKPEAKKPAAKPPAPKPAGRRSRNAR